VIKVDDTTYNHISLKIYVGNVIAYTKTVKVLTSELEQKTLDTMVNRICEIVTRLTPRLSSVNSPQLEKVITNLKQVSNGGGLRIWERKNLTT